MDELDKMIWEMSNVFASDYPRSCSDSSRYQARRTSQHQLVRSLRSAVENGMPGFYSVYSFPNGHPKNEDIPKIDCIFIDLDITSENYDPDNGKTNLSDWRRDMSDLLVRSRMMAKAIIRDGSEDAFRVVLSGHKGIHLYLDFPAIAPENGTLGQFKLGLSQFGNEVVSWIDDEAGGVCIDSWVDVDGSDLARLARHPNTRHHGASHDDVDRWCVAVTVEELASLTVDDYLRLTSEPRSYSEAMSRTESERAGNKAIQHIRTATNTDSSPHKQSTRSRFRTDSAEEYVENVNEEITVDDLLFLTSNKPCIAAFRERDDAYQHGDASRMMELSIMNRFIEMGTPIDVMKEFFSTIPRYDESYTDDLLEDLIGRQIREFNCERIAAEAPEFCLGDDCAIYCRNDEIQKH